MISILPSVEILTITSPLKTCSEVKIEYTFAPPVITIGEVKAARKPPMLGLAATALAWFATAFFSEVSQVSADSAVGRLATLERSSNGSFSDGSVLKNSTPAEKSFSTRPICGTIMTPPGTSTLRKTCSGPSSLRPTRMVSPMPAIEKPPWMPMKKTRWATGVVVSNSPMIWKFESSLRMPPTRPALISPPKSLPVTVTAMDEMPMIGNLPWASSAGRIWMPSMEPENCSWSRPWMPVMLADSERMKSAGSFSMSGHWMPMALILTGIQLGHWKEPPVAEPMARKTPKPGRVLKSPLPVKPK